MSKIYFDNNKYYVEIDKYSYNLYKKRIVTKEDSKNYGKCYYDCLGYYSNIDNLCYRLMEESLQKDELEGLKQLQDSLNEHAKEISSSLKELVAIAKENI